MRLLPTIAVPISYLIATAVVHAAAAGVGSECKFDYVVERGLLATEFIEVTEYMSGDQNRWAKARGALPNVHRVFVLKGKKGHSALVGWAVNQENFSKFTRAQIADQFQQVLSYAAREVYPQARTAQRFDEGPPFSSYITLDYFSKSKGVAYRDVAMDLIATPWCLFSVKFSGPATADTVGFWDKYRREFERIRKAIIDHEGVTEFSELGARFSIVSLINVAIALAVSIAAGAAAYVVLRRWYKIEPGRATRVYCSLYVALPGAMIGATILVNEIWRGDPSPGLPYEGIIIFGTVFFVHLAAIIRHRAEHILAAISLMLGLFATELLYTFIGWIPIPTGPELVGLAFGWFLLFYVIYGSMWRKVLTPDNV